MGEQKVNRPTSPSSNIRAQHLLNQPPVPQVATNQTTAPSRGRNHPRHSTSATVNTTATPIAATKQSISFSPSLTSAQLEHIEQVEVQCRKLETETMKEITALQRNAQTIIEHIVNQCKEDCQAEMQKMKDKLAQLKSSIAAAPPPPQQQEDEMQTAQQQREAAKQQQAARKKAVKDAAIANARETAKHKKEAKEAKESKSAERVV